MNYVKNINPLSVDERGSIKNLIGDDTTISSVLLITSKKGTVRANHYHKKDIHYMYVIKGKMEYLYKDMKKKNSRMKNVIIEEGQIVQTPNMTFHAVKFLENTVFLALTTQ